MTIKVGPRVISEHTEDLTKAAEIAGLDDKQFRALAYMASLGYNPALENKINLKTLSQPTKMEPVDIFSATIVALLAPREKNIPERETAAIALLRGMIDVHIEYGESFDRQKKYMGGEGPYSAPQLPSWSDCVQFAKIKGPLDKLHVEPINSNPPVWWASISPLDFREILFGAIAGEAGDAPARPLSPKERRASLRLVAEKSDKPNP